MKKSLGNLRSRKTKKRVVKVKTINGHKPTAAFLAALKAVAAMPGTKR